MWLAALATVTYLAGAPMTTPNSHSKSMLVRPRGMTIGSNGPVTTVGDFWNR